MNKKSDFVCIGATKAGISWLYDRLNELPNFKMPLHKEIGYFDRNTNWTYESTPLEEKSLKVRIKNLKWFFLALYAVIRHTISNYKSFVFWKHWYFSNYEDKWYKGLFSKGYISGDITPSYALLENSDIEKIKMLCPNTKIIYLIRNQIERAWSQYRMMNPDKKSDDEIIYIIKAV